MGLFVLQVPNPVTDVSNVHIKLLFSMKRSKFSVTNARTKLVSCTPTSVVLSKMGNGPSPSLDLHVQQAIEKQSKDAMTLRKGYQLDPYFLGEAYERCRKICAEYAKTFYLGTLLMTEERKRAIWALYVWCRRTDELVDGPNAQLTSSTVLDSWEERLDNIFNGCPYDMLDSALLDTIQTFHLDIKPFRDMIEGMRMDMWKDRYDSFEELRRYCFYVAGTVGLMTVPILGISPESLTDTESIYNAAICLGIGNQLTNILRDVGEDALRGRIYLPQDDLREFGLKDDDIFSRKITEEWKEFMKKQIARARTYFSEAEQGAFQLDKASRWPVCSSLMLYQKILEEIENNNYDNFTKRAYVGRAKKLLTLPVAYAKAIGQHQPQLTSARK